MSNKINVGCGMTPIIGWSNIDNSWSIRLSNKPILASFLKIIGVLSPSHLRFISFAKTNKIRWADASKHLPFPDKSVDVIYSCHMLEHLNKLEAQSFLRETKRVLKHEGIIRIVVPDLHLFAEDYIKDGDADRFLSRLHMHSEFPKRAIDKIINVLIGNRHHMWNYDKNSLSNLLKESGLSNPTILEAGTTTIAEPGSLDLFERAGESLYIEAKNT